MPSFRAVPNPFPGMGPIIAGGSGFYPRTELLSMVQDTLRAGDSVSLVGERKAGKTSFLNYLTSNLPPDEFVPVFIDTQRIMPRTDQMFLGTLIRKAAEAIGQTKTADTRLVDVKESVIDDNRLLAFSTELLDLIDQKFDSEDLRTLCFQLGVDYDNLPARGKRNKARELILFMHHRSRLNEVINVGRSKRPDIAWPDSPLPSRPRREQGKPGKPRTLQVAAHEAYQVFEEELNEWRGQLPLSPDGRKRRLIWLLDEIETLQGYPGSELFLFLRPFAQTDPDFRIVAGGYDVLYTLSSQNKWSPFFNAFRLARLTGLNPDVAQSLITDALHMMAATMEPSLYETVLHWTGQKPFLLKWMMSKLSQALNERGTDYHIDAAIYERATALFLQESDVQLVFRHLWNTHTTSHQRTVLSLIAAEPELATYTGILAQGSARGILVDIPRSAADLADDLERLQQLAFLYEHLGRYTFTSECLRAWIKLRNPASVNRPSGRG